MEIFHVVPVATDASLGIVGAGRAALGPGGAESDRRGIEAFAGLLATLAVAALDQVDVPMQGLEVSDVLAGGLFQPIIVITAVFVVALDAGYLGVRGAYPGHRAGELAYLFLDVCPDGFEVRLRGKTSELIAIDFVAFDDSFQDVLSCQRSVATPPAAAVFVLQLGELADHLLLGY